MLGKPVQVDRATITRSRVSFARICVEVDLSRPIPEEIDIDIAGKHVTLKVKWDKIPLYCNECKHVGHSAMTCYASGRRPMPPKRDYSQGAPSQSRPVPSRDGVPRRTEQPRATHTEASRQPQVPQRRPHEEQATERTPQPRRQVPHAADEDGFVEPKKKKKTKNANARERYQEKKGAQASSVRAESDVDRRRGAEGDDSASESERGTRSLSPSHRSGHENGPLAMVVRENNMFGALQDIPSDDDEADSDAHREFMITRVPMMTLEAIDPVIQYIGPTSPPPQGTPKRARLTASGTH